MTVTTLAGGGKWFCADLLSLNIFEDADYGKNTFRLIQLFHPVKQTETTPFAYFHAIMLGNGFSRREWSGFDTSGIIGKGSSPGSLGTILGGLIPPSQGVENFIHNLLKNNNFYQALYIFFIMYQFQNKILSWESRMNLLRLFSSEFLPISPCGKPLPSIIARTHTKKVVSVRLMGWKGLSEPESIFPVISILENKEVH